MGEALPVEVFIDTYEPDLWAEELTTLRDEKGRPLKHNLKSMGYDGDILIRQESLDGVKTWGIERKTFTDALNSWMGKRLIKQVHYLTEKVDYPCLLIIDEPVKRLSSSPNNPYRKFAAHLPNLDAHLNRISMEICPVIRVQDEVTALKQVKSLIQRIESDSYRNIQLYSHRVSEPDAVTDFLMGIPKVGKKRAGEFKAEFDSLEDLLERVEDIDPYVRGAADRDTIKRFLTQNWVSKE